MRTLKRLVLVVVVLAVVFAGVGMLLPRQVHVERSITIAAPQATVFALVNGYRLFNKWSPWFDRDPEARYTYEGPDFGVGATFGWASDRPDVGTGSQEIVESRPHDGVTVRLDFGDEGTAIAGFTLAPGEGGTATTWWVDVDMGGNPYMRWFGLLMDRMVGADYEKGLAGLKLFAESLPQADFAGLAVESVDVTPVTVAYVAATAPKDEQAIAAAVGAAYGKVGLFMSRYRITQASHPITINHAWGDSGYEFDVAIPVDRAPDREVPADSPVQVKQTYGGRALKVVHRGAYGRMEQTYEQLMAWMAAHGYEAAGDPWDESLTDPARTTEADLVTHVFMPIK